MHLSLFQATAVVKIRRMCENFLIKFLNKITQNRFFPLEF